MSWNRLGNAFCALLYVLNPVETSAAETRDAAKPDWRTLQQQALQLYAQSSSHWGRVLVLLREANAEAEKAADWEGVVSCHLNSAGISWEAGKWNDAVAGILHAENIVQAHPGLPGHLVAAVYVARHYYERNTGRWFSSVDLYQATRFVQNSPFGLADIALRLSEHNVDLMQFSGSLCYAKAALGRSSRLEGDEYQGEPVGYWRARYKVQVVWVQVAERVVLGLTSDHARDIDDLWVKLQADPDVALWRNKGDVAFLFQYISTWLGFDVRPDGWMEPLQWEQALWWHALRDPKGRPVIRSERRPETEAPFDLSECPILSLKCLLRQVEENRRILAFEAQHPSLATPPAPLKPLPPLERHP